MGKPSHQASQGYSQLSPTQPSLTQAALGWALLSCWAALSCRSNPQQPAPAPSLSAAPAPVQPAALGPSLLTEKPLQTAVATLSAQLGGAIQALELKVYPQRLILQAQDSKRRQNIDQYIYHHGRITGPVPVKLQGTGKLQHNLFPLSELRLGLIPPLAGKALEELRLEGAQVKQVSVKRNLPQSTALRIRVLVKSPRRDAHVDYDAVGNRLTPRPR